jgi:hypothetical protein
MLDDPGIKLTTLGAAVVVKLAFMARAIIVESLCNAKGILGRTGRLSSATVGYYESSFVDSRACEQGRKKSSEYKQRKVLQWE